jgi:predicted amidophosphoribosyltransferase
MAICPHCFSQKSFWAPRCPECTYDSTLLMQLWCLFVYYGTQIFLLWLLYKWIFT